MCTIHIFQHLTYLTILHSKIAGTANKNIYIGKVDCIVGIKGKKYTI